MSPSHTPTARRPSKKAQQLAKLEQIQAHFPTFRFTRMGRDWKYENYPTVKGQRPAIDEIIACINKTTTLRFDNPADRAVRAPRTEDTDMYSMRPYALPN